MAIPVNINDLINGRTIEWERLEFKAGWNPEDVLHTACAFANDLNNWGGGYLIIGVEEKDGRPVLPPQGLNLNEIDAIQKDLINLSHKITPNYFPVVAPVEFQGKHILIIWCPGGDTRPYKATVSLSQKKSDKAYYIKRFSSTIKPSANEEQHLLSLAAKVPFDDRINHHAEIDDLNIREIKRFLKDVNSELFEQTDKVDFIDLCRQMQIVRGADEYLKPINVGLLLFCNEPTRFFPGAKLEIVEFHDDIGDNFTETIFEGPIHVQLQEALRYLKNNVIQERVRKVEGRAEADRFYNYPYAALEEVLANAIYHRSYEHRSTIEVSVRSDKISVLSFPGPLPPVTNEDLKKKRVVSRDYRNRRIGDFLKELQLTEGRNTGFLKIARALKNNGSPEAEYITDPERISFLSVIHCHPDFIESEETTHQTSTKSPPSNELVTTSGVELGVESGVESGMAKEILTFLTKEPLSKSGIAKQLGKTKPTRYLNDLMTKLLQNNAVEYTIPDKPNSRLQKYRLIKKGKTKI